MTTAQFFSTPGEPQVWSPEPGGGAPDSSAQRGAEAGSGDPSVTDANAKLNDGDDWMSEDMAKDAGQEIIMESPQQPTLDDPNPIAATAPAAKGKLVVSEDDETLLTLKWATKHENP